MIVQKEFLGKLKDLGLNSYEAKLWTALLSRGVATAGELSDIAGVPRSRSYDVLESLERKGFIIMKLGKPIKYLAVPPAEVIDRVKKKIKEEAERQDTLLTSMKDSDIIDQLNSIHTTQTTSVDPTDMTGVLKGKENLVAHMNFLLKNAKKSVHIMLSKHRDDITQEVKRGLNKATKNGVSIKIIAPTALQTAGRTDVKKYAQSSLCFLIADEKEVLFVPVHEAHQDPQQDFGVWVSNEHFTTNFKSIFDSIWNSK